MAHVRSLAVLTLTSFAAFGCSQPTDDTPNEPRHVEAAGNPFAPTPREIYYEPDENGARVSGRIDTALLPAGTRVQARLANTEKKSRGAHITCEDGAFAFDDVPPGDWYVIVDAWSPGASWWWSTNVTPLTHGESFDFGTLALLPTQVTVRTRIDRAPSAGPRPDGTTAVDAKHQLSLHANGDGLGPFFAYVELRGESVEHVFLGAPPALCAVAVWAEAPLTPRQRLVDGHQQTSIDLAAGPEVVEIVSTIESGPLTRPHARLHLPPGVRRADIASGTEAWQGDPSGHMGNLKGTDTIDELGFAYIELDPGPNAFTAHVVPRDGRAPWFFSGAVDVEAGLNVGYDFEPVPTVRVELVLPASETLERYAPAAFAPTASGQWVDAGGTWLRPAVDPTTGERRLAACWLPVGWLARVDDRSDHEWLIPAEGGVVHPRPRE